MKYIVNLHEQDGEYIAECQDLGLAAHGLSSTNAIDQLRRSIRYHIEFCPCSTVHEDYIEFTIEP